MANNNIEIESKVLLSKKDYEKVLEKVPFGPQVKVQDNYYLDTPDRQLKKYGMMLRLRKRDGYKLTLKAPLAEGLLEKNQMLSQQEASDLITHDILPEGDIKVFLENLHFDPASMKVLAELTTHRREGVYGGNPVNVSENTYSGKTDYELEVDSDSRAKSKAALEALCNSLDIEFRLNPLSKETRAINAATERK